MLRESLVRLRHAVAGWSLRARLLSGFAVLLLLTLTADGISLLSQRHAQRAMNDFLNGDNRIAELTADARAELLRARRSEKDFLLRVREYGWEEARARYATLLQDQLAGLGRAMAEVRSLTRDPAVAAEAADVHNAAQQYEKGFLLVVELYGRLGRRDAGLEGRMLQSAQALEALLQDSPAPLPMLLLQLRRAEKNFILLHTRIPADRFEALASQLQAAMAQAALAPAQRQELLRLAGDYQRSFADYVAVEAAIDEACQRYLAAAHTVEPLLDRLALRAAAADQATHTMLDDLGRATQWAVAASALVALLLGTAVVLRVGRGIDRALRACMHFAGRVAAGDLQARLPVQDRSELGSMAASLNRMADALQKAQADQAEQAAELRRVNRTLRVLSQCNETLVRATDEAELVQLICRHVVEMGGYRLAWVGEARHDPRRSIAPLALAGVDKDYVDGLALSWDDAAQRHGIAGAAVRDARVLLVRDIAADATLAPWHGAARERGLASCIALPLRARAGVLGVLCIYAQEVDAFDAQEIKVLTELADDLAYGIASLREAAERQRVQRQLEHQAAFDTLTGLANRVTLHARLQQSMADARRQDKRVAVMLLDLDRFKLVNDTLGHHSGDQLLCSVARRLQGSVRECDTVARLGSDEFVVLLKDIRSAADAAGVAAALLKEIAEPQVLDGCELRPAASIGVSLFPDDAQELAALLRNADTAMGHAKAAGGHRFHFFAPEMNQRVAARLALEADLRRALERGELLVHYQPQVSLRGGEVVGAEALVRWHHPRRGMVSPADFIPLAEETGLIDALGEWVLREVCRQQRQWLDQGLNVPQVGVNLSARQFRHPDLVGLVAQSLREQRLRPSLLGLEITESAAMHDVESAIATVTRLRSLGVGLSLDDFGTGYSSLSHLKRFPLDHLKIDRSFVSDLGTDPDSAAICNAVVGLAHSLGLRVVAEGVETESQMLFLRRQRCDELQGYLFSRPLPAADYAALLACGRRLPLPPAEGAALQAVA
ncbi:EAL domain-containing protein [Azohydromonas lata]|uniref:EAL domain-containing protein n=1 Tax=Azohydromonas lata TaxID=45677 RepID=UPI0008301580|nr:EAL domain-containing protein [Azohydromonas lata]